jgi:hypothetical protein
MPLHPAWAKNVIRRVLWAAGDKDIDKPQRAAMAKFFDHCCAYCGCRLPSKWHADHLVPVDKGGTNFIANRVPACPQCNEGEKQDRDWLSFISEKFPHDPDVAESRRSMIEKWIQLHPALDPNSINRFRVEWEKEVSEISAAIDQAWLRLKR